MNTLPVRVSRTHPGTAPAAAPPCALARPVAARYCIAAPFDGETIMSAWRDPPSSVSRNITPAFAQAFTFSMLRTRAVIEQLPAQVSHMYMN